MLKWIPAHSPDQRASIAALQSHFAKNLALFSLFISVLLCMPRAFSQTQLGTGSALYARTLRLSHAADATQNGKIFAAVTAFPATGTEASIYSSSDGTSFTKVGAVTDADFSGGLCCGTLFELPSKVGDLPAGTLLWSASVGQNSTTQAMQLKIYSSKDQGHNWNYLSSCAVGSRVGTTGGGLWEPEFEIASDGALVCIFSDETIAGHSQLLRQVRSYDGLHWQDSTYTVASTTQADRPGMAYVTKLPSGQYLMSYEICGTLSCAAFTRTSEDGWQWGDPTNLGRRVVTADGAWLAHAPTNAWATSASSENGTILLVGQMMYEKDGSLSTGNGRMILTNHTADGSGTWETMPAPIAIPAAYDNYCPNYSSPLLPSLDGQSVLEMASKYDGSICKMYFANGPILAGLWDPKLTATADATAITTAQSLKVTVTVAGTTTPSGTITLSDGNGYTSVATSLTAGTAIIAIPPSILKAGGVTLTANYSGDANYKPASTTLSLTVTEAPKPGISLSGGKLSVTAGAATGNTVSLQLTPVNGFTGSVSLTAQISSAPAGSAGREPVLSFGKYATVSLDGTNPATAVLTVQTTARSQAKAMAEQKRSVVALGFLLLAPFSFCLRRSKQKAFLLLLFACALIPAVTACGGGSSNSGNVVSGTAPGSYVVTVTGTAGDLVTTSTVTIDVL